MSANEGLERWSAPGSDAPAELRNLLSAGRADLGSASEVARLAAGLREALGAGAGLPALSAGPQAPNTSAGSAASPGSAARLWRWLAGGTLAGLLLWGLARGPLGSEDNAPLTGPPTAPTAATPELAAPPVAPPVDVAAPAPLPPSDEAAPPATASNAPPVAAPRPSSSVAARPPAHGKAPALSEAELLQRAQVSLAGDPARALGLTAEHQRRFPRGALVQEREVIAIEALKRLGREQAAAERAAAFAARYRGSVHRSRLREGAEAAPLPTQNR
jgi:hypothetical protein